MLDRVSLPKAPPTPSLSSPYLAPPPPRPRHREVENKHFAHDQAAVCVAMGAVIVSLPGTARVVTHSDAPVCLDVQKKFCVRESFSDSRCPS